MRRPPAVLAPAALKGTLEEVAEALVMDEVAVPTGTVVIEATEVDLTPAALVVGMTAAEVDFTTETTGEEADGELLTTETTELLAGAEAVLLMAEEPTLVG